MKLYLYIVNMGAKTGDPDLDMEVRVIAENRENAHRLAEFIEPEYEVFADSLILTLEYIDGVATSLTRCVDEDK